MVHPVLRQIHSEGAVVTQAERLLLDEECDYLIKKACNVRRSEIEGADGLGKIVKIRTSSTASLPTNDSTVDCVAKRISTIAQMPQTHLEPLQITDYTHKQRYDAHFDDSGIGPRRLKTVFAYLKDDGITDGKCGGSTAFYRLRRDGQPLRVYARKGDAVIWSNFLPDGRHNDRTLHAGESVTCPDARKTGLNAWFLDAPSGTPGKKSARRSTSRRKKSRRSTSRRKRLRRTMSWHE